MQFFFYLLVLVICAMYFCFIQDFEAQKNYLCGWLAMFVAYKRCFKSALFLCLSLRQLLTNFQNFCRHTLRKICNNVITVSHHTVNVSSKSATFLLFISSPIVDQFSKLLLAHFAENLQ